MDTFVLIFALSACNGSGDDSAGGGETDADTDADTDSDTDSDTDADTDSDTDTDTDTDTDSDTDTDTDSDTDTDIDTDIDTSWDGTYTGTIHATIESRASMGSLTLESECEGDFTVIVDAAGASPISAGGECYDKSGALWKVAALGDFTKGGDATGDFLMISSVTYVKDEWDGTFSGDNMVGTVEGTEGGGGVYPYKTWTAEWSVDR